HPVEANLLDIRQPLDHRLIRPGPGFWIVGPRRHRPLRRQRSRRAVPYGLEERHFHGWRRLLMGVVGRGALGGAPRTARGGPGAGAAGGPSWRAVVAVRAQGPASEPLSPLLGAN